MLRLRGWTSKVLAGVLAPWMLVQAGWSWGRDGHRLVNRVAVEALPSDVPEFLRSKTAADAIAWYGPEPDNWKSNAEVELKVAGEPEHFMDLEWADLLGQPLPRKRYDFIRALAYLGKTRTDISFTPETIGLLPYAADEAYERLKAVMRDYRGLVADHQDTRAIEAEIVFLAGLLGHWVGDGSQPLHSTIQYNGWTGANPNGYTAEHRIHAQFESDFVKANVTVNDVAALVPEKPAVVADVFDQYVGFLRVSNGKVEEVYRLEKAGGFAAAGTPAAKTFVDERLAAGATELRDLIYTAWLRSADPIPAYRPATKTTASPAQ